MDIADFDRYCEREGIKPGEEHIAFAAWLHLQTGWDGEVVEIRAPYPHAALIARLRHEHNWDCGGTGCTIVEEAASEAASVLESLRGDTSIPDAAQDA